MNDADLLAPIERLEALQELQTLPHPCAMAVDALDLDAYVDLYRYDSDFGERRRGREVFRSFVGPAMRSFYRCVGHVREEVNDVLKGDDTERRVYGCREDECGDEWIVQAHVYLDAYARRNGRWYFIKRDEDYFCSAESSVLSWKAGLQRWRSLTLRHSSFSMMLGRYATWADVWNDVPTDVLDRITRQPGPTERRS